MTRAEITAAVQATIARYTHALDDGRTEDVVATYCLDGTFELVGTGTFVGHDALRHAYAGWVPTRPQRHLVSTTLVTAWDDEEATATSDVVLLVEGSQGWRVQFVARYQDVLHPAPDGDEWLFHRRTVG